MNRRLRRLLTGGLIGAAAGFLMGMGRKRNRLGRGSFLRQLGPSLHSFIGEIGKDGLWRRLLPLRRRVR